MQYVRETLLTPPESWDHYGLGTVSEPKVKWGNLEMPFSLDQDNQRWKSLKAKGGNECLPQQAGRSQCPARCNNGRWEQAEESTTSISSSGTQGPPRTNAKQQGKQEVEKPETLVSSGLKNLRVSQDQGSGLQFRFQKGKKDTTPRKPLLYRKQKNT